MLQDSRTSRTTANGGGGTVQAGGGRTHTRRMTGNGCSRRSDRTYNMGPTSDLIVNDFDDERTLDEEEAMEGSEDSHNELSNLQKEGDMPLKELLAKYGYSNSAESSNSSDQLVLVRDGDENVLPPSEKNENEADDDDDDDDEEDEEEDDFEDDDSLSLRQFYTEMVKEKEAERAEKTSETPTLGPNENIDGSIGNPSGTEIEANNGNNPEAGGDEDINYEDEDEDEDSEDSESAGVQGTAGVNRVGGGSGGGSSRLLRSVSRPQSEEEDDDCDYSPDEEEWKKTIMVGSDYQATIPEGLCRYDDALPYENEDKILWNPCFIPEEATEEFLERAQLSANKSSLPAGAHVRDDEQALYLLLQCGYNLEEALRRRRMNVLPPTDAISLWSEEECHNFESGLRTYGKDFHLIQKNKVRTRSVGELVQFYYLWKKTERHDIFTYKARLEKKKYALHPGITRDYMDRFLEEQEGVRDRSSSPNVNYLLHGDSKRQRSNASMANNYEGKSPVESWETTTEEPPMGDLGGSEVNQIMATNLPPSILPPPPPPPLPRPSSPVGETASSFLATGQNSTVSNHSHETTPQDYSTTSGAVVSHLPP